MFKYLFVVTVFTLLLLIAGGCGSQVNSAGSALEDGIYGVIQIADQESALADPRNGQQVIAYRPRFVTGGDEEPARWFLIETVSRVPLELTEAPKVKERSIELSLSLQASRALTAMSNKFVGKTAAIVIGGEVATAHVIREPIEMRQLQINC